MEDRGNAALLNSLPAQENISMLNRIVLIALVALGVHCFADRAVAQQPKPAAKEATFRSISDALETSIETNPLRDKLKFKHFLEHISDRSSGQLPLFVDREAFAAEFGPDAPDPMEEEVFLPATPARMKILMALRTALSQIGKGSATYLIRNGVVEITSAKRAAPETLLGYPITARFDKKPLEDAIDSLCEMSGATIIIDPRVGEKARMPVSATFRNSIALDGAVRLLAEMADLQADVQENVLFITNKAKAGGKQEKADLELRNRRLDLAVKDLARWSGQTVLLDPLFVPPPTPIQAPWGGQGKRLEAGAAAKGAERIWVHSPLPGKIEDIALGIKPGSKVEKGQTLLVLFSADLAKQCNDLNREINGLELTVVLAGKNETAEANTTLRHKIEMRNKLRDRVNADLARPGYFTINAPRSGTVLSADLREKLLGKSVKAGESLIQIGMLPGDPTAEPKEVRITATFKPNVSAKAAAEVIARQANLVVIEMDNLLYITHPFMGNGFPGKGDPSR
jgi:biotin carboxyl carrier protein